MIRPPETDIKRPSSVLVVEDEPFIAMELESALSDAGYRVLGPVGSVKSALEIITVERPDTAVLDVNLGRENVVPVAEQLKAMDVPFLIASARSTGELKSLGELADARNIGKPTDLKKLIEALGALLT